MLYNHKQIIIAVAEIILFWDSRDLKQLFHLWSYDISSTLWPSWDVHYIDTSLSHVRATSRHWLNHTALSQLYQVSLLRETCAAMTHPPSNLTYAKEKTTAVRGTRLWENRSLPYLLSQHDQYISTYRDERQLFQRLLAPPHLPALTYHIFYYICRVSSVR